MNFFTRLNTARRCMLELSAAGYQASRVRILAEQVVVEITRPLLCGGAIEERGEYQMTRMAGCEVVWRKAAEISE